MSKKYTMKNGKAVEVSEEIYEYLVKSDRRIRYVEEDLKRNTYIIDSVNEKVTVIPKREQSLDKLMEIGMDFSDGMMDFQDSTILKITLDKRMMDGTYKTASTPFGYDYVNGKLQINPEKAKIVKQIFAWYVSGIGMNEIATRLNMQKVRDEIWRRGTIHCILTNEKYIGDTLLQKTFMTDTLPYKGVINRGEKEQFYVSGTHEPIIKKQCSIMHKKCLTKGISRAERWLNTHHFTQRLYVAIAVVLLDESHEKVAYAGYAEIMTIKT